MITRKYFIATVVSAIATVALVALAQTAAKPIMHSGVFNFRDLKVEQKPTGERRQVFDAPTSKLERLESHITTLNAGEAPHAAHQHPEEEVIILTQGTLEFMHDGQTNRVDTGGVMYCGANEQHGWRNVGTNAAMYYVVKFVPPGQLKPKAQ